MQPKHSLLRRQVKRHFNGEIPASLPPAYHAFLAAVDEAYAGFDNDREMLERSLELSSQELLQATADTRAMFQAIPDLLLRTDRQGNILAVKSGTEGEWLGPASALVGRNIQTVAMADDAGLFRSAIVQVTSQKVVKAIELMRTVGNQKLHYEARLVPTREDQIVVIIRDITELKRTEEVLRNTRQQLERVLSKSPTVVYSETVKRGVVTPMYVSANVTSMLGHEPPDMLHLLESRAGVHPEDVAAVNAAMTALLESGHATVDFRFRHRDGSYRWLRDEQRLLRDANGEPAEIVGSWTDVTERIDLESQLRQSQKMEAIGRLAGGVAHDFNNLLTVIHGYAQLLLTESVTHEEGRELAQEIFGAAVRAGRLTQQLLAFSRKQPPQLQPLDVNQVVSNLGKMLQRIIGEDIALGLEYATELPLVQADSGMMEQVLLNLAINARDAMPEGGEVSIRTDRVRLTGHHLPKTGAIRSGEYVTIQVRDSGCGMSAETMLRIFEPFFTTKEAGKGTGLGLATVYGIVQQHDGWVDVQSEIGRGAVFTVYLPAAPAGTKPQPAPAPVTPARGGNECVLLVEDDGSVRQFARRVLQRAGYRVYDADSAATAAKVWSEHHAEVDLLLTDIVLPDGPGPKLAEQFRTDKPALKVVFASGYSPSSAKQVYGLRPGVDFLSKPYLPSGLAAIIRTQLDADGEI